MANLPPRQWISDNVDVIIADGTSLSAVVPLNGRVLAGIYIPASWSTAAITFTACQTTDGTFVDVFSRAGAELSIAAASSLYLAVDHREFLGVNFLKVRSGTTALAVNQTGAITIQLMFAAIPRD